VILYRVTEKTKLGEYIKEVVQLHFLPGCGYSYPNGGKPNISHRSSQLISQWLGQNCGDSTHSRTNTHTHNCWLSESTRRILHIFECMAHKRTPNQQETNLHFRW